jgi:hypothetical protein
LAASIKFEGVRAISIHLIDPIPWKTGLEQLLLVLTAVADYSFAEGGKNRPKPELPKFSVRGRIAREPESIWSQAREAFDRSRAASGDR